MTTTNAMQSYTVDLYAASYCHWCSETKKFLKSNEIIYNEKPVDNGVIKAELKDILLVSQYEKYGEFQQKLSYTFFKASEEERSDIIKTMNDLYGKNDQEFFSTLQNTERSEDYQFINEFADYLKENPNLISTFNRVYNEEANIISNQGEFLDLVDAGYITPNIPQIIVNGQLFPHEISYGEYSAYYELVRCSETYGSVDSCFVQFINNHDQFMIDMGYTQSLQSNQLMIAA